MTAECKSVLVYAAYFGGQVEREVLEAVVDRCLRWAVNQGLFEDMDENSHTVVFTHDRIQQSIRAFVPEGHVRVKMHHPPDRCSTKQETQRNQLQQPLVPSNIICHRRPLEHVSQFDHRPQGAIRVGRHESRGGKAWCKEWRIQC